jgi:hypothetical protein
MIKVDYEKIVNDEKTANAVVNDQFNGFKYDYYVIHCLISEWKPDSIFEIGTSTGMGSSVMQNAHREAIINTLDIIPDSGNLCPPTVGKYIGDSMTYDFSAHYPIDCWFIDGEHEYRNVHHETKEAIKSGSKYIIYHDADLSPVMDGIIDAFKETEMTEFYDLYFVVNPPLLYSSSGQKVTRVAYAIKK